MKVILFEPTNTGGQARYASDLAEGLAATAREGDDVELVTPRDFPYEGVGYRTTRILPVLGGARRGGRAVNVGALVLRHAQQVGVVSRRIREGSPDVVHVLNTGLLGASVFRQAAGAGSRVVATVHDLPVPVDGRVPRARLLLVRWSKRLPRADLVLVHGRWSAERLRDAFRDRTPPITVVPHPRFDYGMPTASSGVIRSRIGVPEGVPLAMFFGALRREKGLDLLIEALADPRLSKVHLLVAGERSARSEPDASEFRALAESRGVGERLTWLVGHTPDDRIADLFGCADIVVLPYRATFAGQSGVLTIAATYGVPVVASAVGEVADAVTRFALGRCVPPGSPRALATALAEAIREPRRLPADRPPWPTFDDVAGQLWTEYRRVLRPAGS